MRSHPASASIAQVTSSSAPSATTLSPSECAMAMEERTMMRLLISFGRLVTKERSIFNS